MTNEEWRVIADFPRYRVSSLGHVQRFKPDAHGHRVTGKDLKPCTAKGKAYQFVTLCHDGVKKQMRVNRLVCEAFHGPPPTPAHHAAHNDGDSSNNRAGNLRWATGMENEADKRKHGTAAIGERHWSKLQPERRARGEGHGKTKLSDSDIRAIRQDGRGPRALAAAYGVHRATIGSILARRTWGHVQ